MKIGFIGLGKLGMPCAEEIAKKGHAVLGYDVDKSLNSDYVIVEETIKEVAVSRYRICCSTYST